MKSPANLDTEISVTHRPVKRGKGQLQRIGKPVLLGLPVIPWILASIYSWNAGVNLNLFESGTLLSGGTRMLHGDLLYSEIFAFYGPLTYLAPTVLADMLGGDIRSVYLAEHLLDLFCILIFLHFCRHLTESWFITFVSTGVASLAGICNTRTAFPLLAIHLLSLGIKKSRQRYSAASGVAAACSVLYFQDGGALLLASLAVCTSIAYFRNSVRGLRSVAQMRAWGVGFVAVLAPVMAYMSFTRTLDEWLYYCFFFPNVVYVRRSATSYVLGLMDSWAGLSPAVQVYKYSFYLMPYVFVGLLAIAGVATCLFWRRLHWLSKDGYILTVLAVYGLLQLRTLAASLDEAKLASTMAPTMLVGIAIASRELRSRRRWSTAPRRLPNARILSVMVVCLTCFLSLFLVQRTAHIMKYMSRSSGETGIATAGPPEMPVTELEAAIRVVADRTAPDDEIFVAPTQPLLYYLTGRTTSARFDYLDPIYVTAQEDAEMVQSLRSQPPRLVVLADNRFPGSDMRSESLAPETLDWVRESYVTVTKVGHFEVLEAR